MKMKILILTGLLGCSVGAQAPGQAQEAVRSRVLTNQAAESESEPVRVPATLRSRSRAAAPGDTTVDSVAEDLRKIVVLCATQPESDEFLAEWVSYVRRHRIVESELDAVIADVIRRAEAHQAERRSGQRTDRMLTNMTSTSHKMHETAKNAISNIR